MDRRETLAWLARALAMGLPGSVAGRDAPAAGGPRGVLHGEAPGYGRDPDLAQPGVPWPLTLGPRERATVTRLADLLLPADELGPAASALGVPQFVAEWMSAPYPLQRADRAVLESGLEWLDTQREQPFVDLDDAAARQLLAVISDPASGAAPEAKTFFRRLRQVCLIGYYSSAAGMQELGYLGNRPSSRFEGPPPEVVARLGLDAPG